MGLLQPGGRPHSAAGLIRAREGRCPPSPVTLPAAKERRNLHVMSETVRQNLLPTAPRADVFSVSDLIQDLHAGRVRIPEFQRGWKWKREQILNLLDSIYRGYPIGSLLFWQRPRQAERLVLGPREIVAPERSDALEVIDGQQRLTSLFGTLAHPDPRPNPADDFVAFFDPSQGRFLPSPAKGVGLPDGWIPVAQMLDAAELQDWLLERPFFQENKDLRRNVLEAAKRLREARIPSYTVEAKDDQVPREIFRRINRGGSPMEESDVFNSIVGRHANPGKIEDLEDEIAALGMGKEELRRHKLLQCVMAVAGLDVTRRLDDKQVPEELQRALAATAPALRSALVFLENDARIRHLRLLPFPFPLIVLCRFFHVFPEPNSRSRLLLVRWVWRGMMTAYHDNSEKTALRASVQAIQSSEEEQSVQRLLRLVPTKKPESTWWLAQRFDGRSAASRIAGLWFASLEPREVKTGDMIDIKNLLDQEGADAFRPWPKGPYRALASISAAGRILHPRGFRSQRLVELAQGRDDNAPALLASHGFQGQTIDSIRMERWEQALLERQESLRQGLARLADRMAAWNKNDRPSLSFLLAQGKQLEKVGT